MEYQTRYLMELRPNFVQNSENGGSFAPPPAGVLVGGGGVVQGMAADACARANIGWPSPS
jgi:hypothetical protein